MTQPVVNGLCGQCGVTVDGYDGEVTAESEGPRGWRVIDEMTYTLKPCGHTFTRRLNTEPAGATQ